ncbi:MAG: tripartite tricarboxylate transporter substrate binding protein [Hyphomicrobiales bacterium]|nr:tripartite tricarboxylate transporter substrate binding protein [Hyphomicrobiales bacterium]
MPRRLFTILLALLCTGALARAAEDYPNRPITLIVPYPAGGGVDTMGRLIGQALSAALGEQVVIENRGGAGGMLGTRTAVKAAPDGYTLVMTLTGLSLGPNPGYDFRTDLAPIGLIAFTPVLVVAHPSLPAKSLAEVIALAKKDPGKLAIGTPPPPTINYFAVELFKMMAGADVSTITYRGTAPLTNDLLGGHVLLGFSTIPATIGNIEAGTLRPLAVTAATRAAVLPDVPTSAESGLPGFEAGFYYGMSAPAGTPRPIIDKLNAELRRIVESEEMRKRLVQEGTDPTTSTPEEYAANLEREEAKWAALIRKLGLKFD